MLYRSIPMLEGRRAALLLALALAALAAAVTSGGRADAGGGGHCRKPDIVKDAAGSEVTISENCFSPMVLRVDRGASVTFRNEDAVVHDAVGWSAQWSAGLRQGGGSQAVSFPTAGYFAYACSYHPGMNGIIIVGDEPVRAAVASTSGGAVAAKLAGEPAMTAPAAGNADPALTAGVASSDDWAGRGFAGALGAIASPMLLALGLLGYRRLRGGTDTR